ncbi:MAG: carboxypeptidase regulatory-like domain-containing protein [Vicinamibacterales bacterium]|nr:carboxypeptidase regulatory-like domain-containing protein [Vicinamibacterales bacterium]
MKQCFGLFVLVTGVLFGLASPVSAQVSSTGSIEVIVEDADGGRLPGVVVTAEAVDAITRRTGVTDGQGVAVLDALAPSAQYVVKVELPGFQEQTLGQVLVRTGQTARLRFSLSLAGVAEAVTVTASAPIVDVRTATTGQDITLQLTESLPTGRSYQSYLQLVPGVMPDDPTTSGNPAARGGINYSDIAGNLGVSSDNAYYFDGINVTDPVTGTFGANLNTEIIQEQKVITGAIPAEYIGTPGLISNVVTKSGSNMFTGSVNYFFQNSNLMSENKNGPDDEFSTKDNGYTIGGPLMRNKAWFFGSYRYTNREDDVSTLDTRQFLRTVGNTQHQGFAKASWAPTTADLLSFTYLSDPTEITGRRERDITNARDRGVDQGGHRFGGLFTRVWGSTLLEVGANKHNGELSQKAAIREPFNDIVFQRTDARTLADEQLGGFGQDLINERDTQGIRASLSQTVGRHTLKAGVDWSKNTNFRDTLYVGDALYRSLAAKYAGAGVTAAGVVDGSWTLLRFDHSNPSDYGGFLRSIDARADRARFYALYDLNGDGTISQAELGQSLVFASTAGNPNGAVNYDRTLQSATGPQETYSKGLSFFAQDIITLNRLTLNVGVRAERWEHFATTGENIYTFPWAFAPRLSAIYDVRGDGRHKASAYWGRYYDPIRNNMTNFAGTLTGSVLEEQVYAGGEWITYRTRGGATQQDAFFAPTTKTPYTDDLTIGYAVDLGRNTSFEASYINRRTRDILEDYDLELYATAQDGQIHYPGPIDHPDSLFLGLGYFGYSQNPGSNFVIATLAGGKRDYQGVELVFRKRFSDRWQMLTSYNWSDQEGNTNSDSNADFQGDVDFLDPRAPNQFGRQPGNVVHLLKGGGSYTFDFGLQVGGTFNWNSGTVASRTFRASGRNLPIRVLPGEAFEFAGYTTRWLAPDSVGSLTNPSWGTVDVRVQYNRTLAGRTSAEVFVDVFNVANNQNAMRNQDLVAGLGTTAFGDPIQWITARRAFLGARLRF